MEWTGLQGWFELGTRSDYLTSLRLAQTGQKDERPFINFITNVAYESTKDYLRLLRTLCNSDDFTV